jgi:hypothetical protein
MRLSYRAAALHDAADLEKFADLGLATARAMEALIESA